MDIPPFRCEDDSEWTEGLGGRYYALERTEVSEIGDVLVAHYVTTDREHPPQSREEEFLHEHYTLVIPRLQPHQIWVLHRTDEGLTSELIVREEADSAEEEAWVVADAFMQQVWEQWMADLQYHRAMRQEHAKEWQGE